MRVAIVSPHPITPADSGDRVRTAALASQLAAQGVDATVIAYSWEAAEPVAGDPVTYVPGRPEGTPAKQLWRLRLAAARRTNAFALHQIASARRAMQQAIDELAPDVVDFQHSFTWFDTGRPSIVTVHNVESDRLSRFGDMPRAALDGAIESERTAVETADAAVVFSELDAHRLRRLTHPRDLRIVPLGYDPGTPRARQRDDCTVAAYIGSMDYEPNIEAGRLLLTQWETIRRTTSLRRLLVIGRHAAAHFRPDHTVEVLSDVADVRAALEPADVLVVPLVSGGGVRVKIIEALGLGLPVVSTALGIEGLGAIDGRHAIIVDSVNDLAAGLARVGDLATRQRLAANGRELWAERYSAASMAASMTSVYGDVLRTAATAGSRS